MKILVTVCENNSVTQAAEKLHIAQPSVSLAVRELEEYYGVKLFDRIARRMQITEAGKQFLNYAVHIVGLFDDLEKGIRDWESIGTLRLGSSITIGNYLLPYYVKAFEKKYPNIKLQVTIKNSEEIEKRILSNEIDFGLIEGIKHNSNIMSDKFMEDELILICGRDHQLASKEWIELEELRNYNMILREKGSGGREILESTLLIHDIEIEPAWESVSNRAIIKAVGEGLGLSVLPLELVRQDLENGLVKRLKIKDISLKRFFYIIYHENKLLTDSMKEFMSLCKEGLN